jgi:hypothetical protein
MPQFRICTLYMLCVRALACVHVCVHNIILPTCTHRMYIHQLDYVYTRSKNSPCDILAWRSLVITGDSRWWTDYAEWPGFLGLHERVYIEMKRVNKYVNHTRHARQYIYSGGPMLLAFETHSKHRIEPLHSWAGECTILIYIHRILLSTACTCNHPRLQWTFRYLYSAMV